MSGTLLLKERGLGGDVIRSRKLLRPTPTRRNRCCESSPTRPRSDRAMVVNSSQEEGGEAGVWLRVRILKSLVLSLSTTVRAMRDSLRDAAQVCSASLRIIGSISVNGTSRRNVSSVDRWRVTGYREVMPRNRLSATWDRSPAKVACVLISSNPVLACDGHFSECANRELTRRFLGSCLRASSRWHR